MSERLPTATEDADHASPDEHPFAAYVRALGRGRRSARSLAFDEARTAMGMVLDGQADPLQTGAFLMLLRMKEETADEIAGFTLAARERARLPAQPPAVDLDWPSYAGKRQQPPWFLLAALLLAAHGHRVLMHGGAPQTTDRLYTPEALGVLGIAPAHDWDDAARALDAHCFAYVPLALPSPALQQLLALRRVFGLRSPVNTFVRHLNPLGAPASMQSLQHPAYARLHGGAARRLGQASTVIFRGDGGECELRPQADSRCLHVVAGSEREILFPRLLATAGPAPCAPAAGLLGALWSGERADDYGEAAVIGTAALALIAMRCADGLPEALEIARGYWHERGTLPGATAR